MNHIIVLNLDSRKDKLDRMDGMLKVPWSLFPAVVGNNLDLDQFDVSVLTDSFKQEIKERNLYGHLGASMSHIGIWNSISYRDLGVTLVDEDDVIKSDRWHSELKERMKHLPYDWDILLLGFACSYDSTDNCHWNDDKKIENGIVKVGKFIGLWSYLVNGKRAADKLLANILPLNWIVDHEITRHIHKNDLQVYGCVPNIVIHPGNYSIDSFSDKYSSPMDNYVSDTNAKD